MAVIDYGGGGDKMKKTGFSTGLFLVILAVLAASAPASEIGPITLTELYDKADLIVMAQVTGVVAREDQDEVTIKTEKYLKGDGPESDYTFTLVTRGKLKDFDPSLTTGDTGVFFLKRKSKPGQVEKAWWGGVAVFVKNNFDPLGKRAEGAADKPLAAWSDYRIKLKQIQNMTEYGNGFRQGFFGQPLIPKSPVDFNQGHSDGRLAREGMVPSW
jgi:hypothetical protein